MEVVDTTQINSFAPIAEQTDFVSSSEKPVFILTSSQFQDLVNKAVQEAIQTLQDRISSLEDRTAALEEENESLHQKVSSLESTKEQDIDRICLNIAYDRQRISKLEQKPASATIAPPKGAKTLVRIAKIHEVLKARGATTLKELKRILNIAPKEMNRLLAKLDMRRYELHSRPGDGREKVLRLKTQIS